MDRKIDPAPSELEDIHTQNGYCYVGNNPVMQADPSGEVFWFAVNAAFAAYDGYQAYKAGKGWGEIALSTAVGFVGGGRIKGASKLVKGVSKLFKGSKGKKVLPRSVKKTAPKPKGHGKAKPPVKKYAVSKKKIISGKTKGHVKKAPVKKTTGGGSKGKGSGSSSSKGKGSGSNSSSKGTGTKKQKKVEKGNASNPEKKHNVVVRSTQRHLSEGERQALQSFLFKARKQNSLRSVKWKSSGREVYSVPKGGGGVTGKIKLQDKTITFGHGGRHLEGSGLSVTAVNKKIANDIAKKGLNKGEFYKGTVKLEGKTVEYTSYGLGNGKINIGTYYPK